MWQIVGAIGGGILGGLEAMGNSKAINKAAVKNYKAAVKAISTNYNYGNLRSRTAIKSEYSEAKRSLENLTFNSRQNQSTIRAAIAETGTEGRSTEKLQGAVQAHDLRTTSSVKENATIVAANYLRQMEADRLSAKSQIKQAKTEFENSIVSTEETFFNMLTGAMKGAASGYSFGSMAGNLGSMFKMGGGGVSAADFGAAGKSTVGIAGNAGFGR